MARAFGSYPTGRWFKSDFRYQIHFGRRHGPLVKRLRHRPFTAVTGVRFSHGSPKNRDAHLCISVFSFGDAVVRTELSFAKYNQQLKISTYIVRKWSSYTALAVSCECGVIYADFTPPARFFSRINPHRRFSQRKNGFI